VSTANRGTLTNPAGNWAGDVNLATITGPSNTYTPAITPPDRIADVDTPSHSIVLGTTGNTWSLVTRFDQGPMPQDSTGAPYPSERFPTNGTRTDSTSVEGILLKQTYLVKTLLIYRVIKTTLKHQP
jgi:hypothetical protein